MPRRRRMPATSPARQSVPSPCRSERPRPRDFHWRDTKAQHAHQDVYAAIRDAFDAARRQLVDYARERRGEAKMHRLPDHGGIVRFLPEQDCGFILSTDGLEIYFHRKSVPGEPSISSRLAMRCALRAVGVCRRAPWCSWANIACRLRKSSARDFGRRLDLDHRLTRAPRREKRR
jgi:hypothetical protein